jgi:hypothetical protein
MKSIRQISKETGVDYQKVFRTVRKEGLIVERGTKMMLTIHQEDYIHDVLFYSGYFTELTIESKMNKPEAPDYDAFRKFKKETYGKTV